MNHPMLALHYHCSGAIARGEAEPIIEQPARLLSTIPFQGFYESIHDDAIDSAIDDLLQDSSGDPIAGLVERFWSGSYESGELRELYAKDYATEFAVANKLQGLQFDEVSSPREYNFQTDRIFVTIPTAEVVRLLAGCDREALKAAIHDRFTSRSGFISFYSNKLEDWPDSVEQWDCNQVGTLIETVCQFDEDEYAGEVDSNGDLSNWLSECLTPAGERLAKVASYLRERAERA